jgi:hypothetical protein
LRWIDQPNILEPTKENYEWYDNQFNGDLTDIGGQHAEYGDIIEELLES